MTDNTPSTEPQASPAGPAAASQAHADPVVESAQSQTNQVSGSHQASGAAGAAPTAPGGVPVVAGGVPAVAAQYGAQHHPGYYTGGYNANYNGGNTGNSGNKHYNKNFNGRQNFNGSGANRQHYNNSNSNNNSSHNSGGNHSSGNNASSNNPNQSGNRKPYNNNANNSNNANSGNGNPNSNSNNNPNKIHHNQNYNYNSYPAANMYPYQFIPTYGYQVMPLPYGAIPTQQYVPQIPQQQPVTPTGTKVKLTTKDGKPVDLEEKKKKTASNTPISSPAPSTVSPVGFTPSPAPLTAAVVEDKKESPAAAPKSAANSAIAEEFKRKIRERAAALAKAKEEEKNAEESKQEEPKKEEPKKEEPKSEELKSEEPKSEEPKQAEATTTPEIKKETIKEAHVANKEEVKEDDSVKKDEPTASEPELEKAEAPIDYKKSAPEAPEAVATEAQEVSAKTDSIDESDVVENETVTKEAEVPETSQVETTPTTPEETSLPEPESSFTISNFLSKLESAELIEDAFTTKYPEGIQGPDASKKLESKKYRYDPQFLVQFRSVIQYPIDPEFKAQLEKVDINTNIVKKGAQSGSSRNLNKFNNLPNRFNGQLPRGAQFNDGRQNSRNGSKRRNQGGSSRDKSTRKGNQSKRGGRDFREKTEEELAAQKPAEEVKPLEVSANRWVPRSRTGKKETRYAEDGTEILEPEDVERKVKSLLNKLTLEMFSPITDDVLKIADQSKWEKDAQTVKSIISLTFAKACDEPYWSEMYAKFCAKMCTNIPEEVTDETITLKDGTHPSGGALARRLLLTTCQTEYERGWVDKLPTNEDGSPLEPEMMSEEYYIMAAAKRRGLGLVKFIGHLYNLNMLNDQVIYVCLRDQCKNVIDPSEDSLENLVQLVKTVGPKLDAEDKTRPILKVVFENIDTILKKVKLSSRIMFMLMDLQDLRKSRWSSDKAEAGPKTIEEIHRDAEIKRMEDQKASNEKKQRRINEGRSNSSRGSSWNNSGSNNFINNLKFSSSNRSTSSSGPNNSNNNSNSNSNTTSDAAVPQRETSKRSESTHVNRFAALGDHDDNDGGED
ncbi:Tif4631 translation initiation factor eIF4G [Scheffersomyces xylosifermentans]|uniref:Tif4631 translation initiation factor eIF4G n=1 Tax=Scheffersomyces xylosifermentans TaxID=1304137 RepID=UPI00315D81A9